MEDNRRSYSSEYEREYLIGGVMKRMDSLIEEEALTPEYISLRNRMIKLQEAEADTGVWQAAAAGLSEGIVSYLESEAAEHRDELEKLLEVLKREEVYSEKGFTEAAELEEMSEEACDKELSDIGKKLEAVDMLEELMQDKQEELAELSLDLEDTESFGWNGDEYIKLRDDVHAFLRMDEKKSVNEIGEAADKLADSSESLLKSVGGEMGDIVKAVAGTAAELRSGIEKRRPLLDGDEPLEDIQGRLDVRMEELIDVSERHRIRKEESRKKIDFTDLKEKEGVGPKTKNAQREEGKKKGLFENLRKDNIRLN